MKNESLYNKTVDILVQAYFNDELEHGTCFACAVGNIVNFYGFDYPEWDNVFSTMINSPVRHTKIQKIHPENYINEAKQQIDATGYAWQELAKIEYAFETANEGNSAEDYMFNGLMAVIDALDKIHENKDIATTKISKNKFTKTQLQTI